MTKKRTTKKVSRESKLNRGRRIGKTVRSVQMRLPSDLVDWIDEQARTSGMSRTQWCSMVLEASRKFSSAADSSGLFADMEQQIEGAVRRALDDIPRPDLERLLAKKKR